MDITLLLLLALPLASATPLRAAQRRPSEGFVSGAGIQTSEVERSAVEGSEVRPEGHVPWLRIIPFHLEGQRQDVRAMRTRLALRPRRAPQRGGCQLGTCQLHNLANTLYQIGNTSGKDESKNAHDPQGFGR